MKAPRVVILGAGFGGIEAARGFAGKEVAVTVVDRQNHHLFQPLLYQVATAGLSATDIAAPVRGLLSRQANTDVVMAEVTAIDLAEKKVRCGDGREIPFDFLIAATGAVSNYFGKPEWETYAPSLKDLGDALKIRDQVLLAFERAELAAADGRGTAAEALLTFVVVGGGATGVEVAGSLAELAHRTLARDFRFINPASARVVLLEGGSRVLAAFSENLSTQVQARLEKMGVSVRLGRRVETIDAEGVTIVGGDRIEARTVIWAAGVAASPVAQWLGGACETDRTGRVKVDSALSVPGHRRVFVIGDAACAMQNGRPLPGLAPVAIQQGRYVARRVLAMIDGQEAPPEMFSYFDKGNLATVGRSFAVADLSGVHIGRFRLPLAWTGRTAWAAWVVVHIAYLISFRNRLLVLVEWAWAYLTWQRGARLAMVSRLQSQSSSK